MKMQCIIINIFKKLTSAIYPLPPAYSVYCFDNDDNSGQLLTQLILSQDESNYDPAFLTLLAKKDRMTVPWSYYRLVYW